MKEQKTSKKICLLYYFSAPTVKRLDAFIENNIFTVYRSFKNGGKKYN
jgi:hypothetical protein